MGPQHIQDAWGQFAYFISEQAMTGSYRSADDIDGAQPRLQKACKGKAKELQDALIVGEESGEPQPFDFEAFKARKRAEYEGR